MTALAALGLKYYSPGSSTFRAAARLSTSHELSDENLAKLGQIARRLRHLGHQHRLRIGKVKLLDVATARITNTSLPRTIWRAKWPARSGGEGLNAKLIRGFSFYQPAGDDPWKYMDQAVERLRPIVDECGARAGLWARS